MIFGSIQVKIFSGYKHGEVESQINDWLSEHEDDIEIVHYGYAAAPTGDSRGFDPSVCIAIWHRTRI